VFRSCANLDGAAFGAHFLERFFLSDAIAPRVDGDQPSVMLSRKGIEE
jgi:hypothetical protein